MTGLVLNAKNYKMLTNNGVDVRDAEAQFVSNKVIEIVAGDDRQSLQLRLLLSILVLCLMSYLFLV